MQVIVVKFIDLFSVLQCFAIGCGSSHGEWISKWSPTSSMWRSSTSTWRFTICYLFTFHGEYLRNWRSRLHPESCVYKWVSYTFNFIILQCTESWLFIVEMFCFTVRLHGQSINPTFRGFMIQGRTMANDTPTGFFIGSSQDYRSTCDDNVRRLTSYCMKLLWW